MAARECQSFGQFGTLCLENGKRDGAQDVLQQAEKLNPNDPETEYNLALALNQLARTRKSAFTHATLPTSA
jgi:Flp pilus assembly protein TadD